jgi:hypothetical protein
MSGRQIRMVWTEGLQDSMKQQPAGSRRRAVEMRDLLGLARRWDSA